MWWCLFWDTNIKNRRNSSLKVKKWPKLPILRVFGQKNRLDVIFATFSRRIWNLRVRLAPRRSISFKSTGTLSSHSRTAWLRRRFTAVAGGWPWSKSLLVDHYICFWEHENICFLCATRPTTHYCWTHLNSTHSAIIQQYFKYEV